MQFDAYLDTVTDFTLTLMIRVKMTFLKTWPLTAAPSRSCRWADMVPVWDVFRIPLHQCPTTHKGKTHCTTTVKWTLFKTFWKTFTVNILIPVHSYLTSGFCFQTSWFSTHFSRWQTEILAKYQCFFPITDFHTGKINLGLFIWIDKLV